MNIPEKEWSENDPEMGEQEKEQEMPEVAPGLEEIPFDKEIDDKPKVTPEQRQEIIDGISHQEEEEAEHEKEVQKIIDKIHKKEDR